MYDGATDFADDCGCLTPLSGSPPRNYSRIARDFSRQWALLARGGRGGAARRQYNVSDSWSLKYNLLWDRIFGTGLFDSAIDAECGWYMQQANATGARTEAGVRQTFGWLLDDRSASDPRGFITNSGWAEWAAAMCGGSAVRDL